MNRRLTAAHVPCRDNRSVLAAYRPRQRDIAIFVEEVGGRGPIGISIAEARVIHEGLGRALQLAALADDPVAAVPGEYVEGAE